MPTTVKTSTPYANLGDLSTYSVATSAIPVSVNDSSGSVPTVSSTFVDGSDVEYLIGENFALTNPTVGSYDGEIVAVNKAADSSRYSLDVHNIMNRLNTDHRVFPLADFNGVESNYLPAFALEYWTQQCGIFTSKIDGDVLFYQSQWGHYGAFAKDISRPLKSSLSSPSGYGFQGFVNEGRIMNSFPRNSEALITFPGKARISDMGSYLPVLIPAEPATDMMVFGSIFGLFGTSRQGDVTWRMVDAMGKKKHIRIRANTTTGFTLYTSEDGVVFTSRANISAAAGTYSVYVGVSKVAGGTKLDFRAYKTDNSLVVATQTTVAGSGIYGSLTLQQVSYASADTGSGSALMYADVFIALMKAMPSTYLQSQKSITPGTKTTSFLVGFSGNVWEHIKQYCAIYHLDVNYRNGVLTIEPRQKDLKVGASFSSLNTKIQNRETARNVEVINRRHTATGSTAKVLWAADTVYQVAVGETQEFTVQTEHSIMDTSQPVCVSGITPYPYTTGAGQYVVTGSDGYIVSPAFWADQGGSITTDITEVEGEIKIVIKGPDFDSSRAPYRISEGDAGRPALYITGTGVLSDPVTLKVPTGKSKAAKDIGATIDSPFIGNAKQAYDAAVAAARTFAVPEVSAAVNEPVGFDEVSKLGTTPAGALVKYNGNILRVTDATQNPSVLSANAAQHNTIYQLKRSFPGATIGQMNAYYAGKPIGKINLKPLKVVK